MYITQQRGHLSDRFTRVKRLGSGAYGEVLLCRDKQSGAERAIKIIKKTSVSAPSSGALLDEVAVLKQLDHPNIMKLYEFFEDKRNYYLVSVAFVVSKYELLYHLATLKSESFLAVPRSWSCTLEVNSSTRLFLAKDSPR